MKAKNQLHFQHIGLVGRSKVAGHEDFLNRLKAHLESKGAKLYWDDALEEVYGDKYLVTRVEMLKKADLVITLGGDGTILKLVRDLPKRKNLFVFGVNLGNVGFLTEAKEPEKAFEQIDEVLKGRFTVDERMLLRATLYREGKKIATHLALNDVVINQGNFARLISLSAEINQRKMIDFKADGIILATPTGSTGHSLSAGGPIVHPTVDAILFVPICPAELTARPIIVPSTRQINLSIKTERRFQDNQIGLTIDGQVVIPVQYGDEIKIRRSSRRLRFARRTGEHSYYRLLKDSLGWGKK